MRIFITIVVYLIIGFILSILSSLLDSKFLTEFFNRSLITILITLAALSNATFALLVNKLKEIESKLDGQFDKTYSELKFSIITQLLNVFISLIILTLSNSSYLLNNYSYVQIISNTLLTGILICSLDIIRDIFTAIFEIIRAASNLNNKK